MIDDGVKNFAVLVIFFSIVLYVWAVIGNALFNL